MREEAGALLLISAHCGFERAMYVYHSLSYFKNRQKILHVNAVVQAHVCCVTTYYVIGNIHGQSCLFRGIKILTNQELELLIIRNGVYSTQSSPVFK